MKISVIVPTYKRQDDLNRCLTALAAQHLPADEVIVIARFDDQPTISLIGRWIARGRLKDLRVEFVGEGGVVAAYNRGLVTAGYELILFTDDDAAPHPDWVARIHAHFEADPAIGGVGGRDIVYERGQQLTGAQTQVGQVSWYGRMVGNHHLGVGEPRPVMVLKGVNMGWRASAIEGLRFDTRLRGSGAQVHCELAFSLAVARRGYQLIYDPQVQVDHFPAKRADIDQRFVFNEVAFFNASFNLRLIISEALPPASRIAFLIYITLIGSRADPGLLRALLLVFAGESPHLMLRKVIIGIRAMRMAWRQAARDQKKVGAAQPRRIKSDSWRL